MLQGIESFGRRKTGGSAKGELRTFWARRGGIWGVPEPTNPDKKFAKPEIPDENLGKPASIKLKIPKSAFCHIKKKLTNDGIVILCHSISLAGRLYEDYAEV